MVYRHTAGAEMIRQATILIGYVLFLTHTATGIEISRNTIWTQPQTLSEPVTVLAGKTLTIRSTTVHFTSSGQIICNPGSALQATDTAFVADGPSEGKPYLACTKAGKAYFSGCTFRKLSTKTVCKHTNSALHVSETPFYLNDCQLYDCASVVVIRTSAPRFAHNYFVNSSDHALIVWHCDRASVTHNCFRNIGTYKYGLYLKCATNATVSENRFHGSGKSWGIVLRYSANSNLLIANAIFRCYTGIMIWGSDCHDNSIMGSLIFHPQITGVHLHEAGAHTSITNTVVWGAGKSGLIVEKMTAPATISNTVVAMGGCELVLKGRTVPPKLRRNCFWKNGKKTSNKVSRLIQASNSIFTNPCFVAPEAGNFRLQSKLFGHAKDSPLIGAGTPKGCSIGLYP